MSAAAPPPPLLDDALDLAPGQVSARLRAARRRGQPAWLWPEVPVSAWRAALRQIEIAARWVLTGGGRAALPAEGPAAVRALGLAAYTSGTGPLLGYWLEIGALEAADAAAALLAVHLRHGRRRMARLSAEAAAALHHLAQAGVAAVLLKGVHTAHAYFPDPGTRPCSDIDLLVAPADLAAAERVLAAAGYTPGRTQRRPYKREWAPPGAKGAPRLPRSLELAHADDAWTIDLHASLERNFFGVATVRPAGDAGSDGAGIPTRPWLLPTAGAHVPSRVLAHPAQALFLATHASEGLHNLTLIRLIELALVLRRDAAEYRDAESPGIRGRPVPASPCPRVPVSAAWRALVQAAEQSGALRFAHPALALCERFLPGTVPGGVRARFAAAATPAQQRVLAQLTPATAQRLDRLSLEERFMWAATPRERLRRLLHGAWPAPAGRSPAELWRIYAERAWRLARGTVGR